MTVQRLGFGFSLLLVLSFGDAAAQTPGSCESGSAENILQANGVRAAIFNNGSLFWKGGDPLYRIGGANSIYTTSLWIGGMVNGELRFAGTQYGPFDFHAGPLTESGELPDSGDCSEYDRIFRITELDLARLDSTDEATDDIPEWPWHLGAPVKDGDGVADNYNLAGWDRPEITGHEMLWWVMNDVGGSYRLRGWALTVSRYSGNRAFSSCRSGAASPRGFVGTQMLVMVWDSRTFA